MVRVVAACHILYYSQKREGEGRDANKRNGPSLLSSSSQLSTLDFFHLTDPPVSGREVDENDEQGGIILCKHTLGRRKIELVSLPTLFAGESNNGKHKQADRMKRKKKSIIILSASPGNLFDRSRDSPSL